MGNDLKVVLTMVDNMSEKLTGVETRLGSFGKSIDNMMNMWKGFAGALAGVLAVEKIEAFVEKGIEYGDAIHKMSKETGLQTEETQKLDYILKESGSSLTAMTRPLINLSKEAYNGNVAFKVLGISLKDQNGNLKNSGTLFEEAITKLGGISNTTERAAIAQKLFGKGTKDVLGLVAEGTENIKRYSDETEKYGLILDDKMIRELDEAKKAGVLFDQAMKVASANLAVAFAPALIAVAQLAASAAKALRDMFSAVNPKDVASDLAKEQVQALQQEEIQLKKNIELAGKNQDATVVWMRSNGEMGHDKLRVAQAELVALQSQLKMNEALVKQNAPKSTSALFNPDDFKTTEKNNTVEYGLEMARKEEEEKARIQQRALAAHKKDIEEEAKIDQENIDNKWKMFKAENDEIGKLWKEQEKATEEHNKIMVGFAIDLGTKFGQDIWAGLAKGKVDMKQAMKDVLIMTVDFLEKEELAAIAANTLHNVVTEGYYGLIVGAVEAAGISAVGEIVKGAINSFAVGTPYSRGGTALVGERGPERVYLPAGSSVKTAGQTAAMGGGSGGEVHIHIHDANGNVLEAATQQLRSRQTADRFVSMVFEHAKKMGKN